MVSSIARLVFLVLVFSTSAFIQAANFTNSFDGIVLNHPIDLTWTGDGTPVTIKLLAYQALVFHEVETIAANVPASPYTWTPSSPIAMGDRLLLSITQSNSDSYSSPFSISATSATTLTFGNTPIVIYHTISDDTNVFDTTTVSDTTTVTSATSAEEAVTRSLNSFSLVSIEKRTDVGTVSASETGFSYTYPSRQPIAYPTRYLNITGTATGSYADPTGYINSSYSGYSVMALSPIESQSGVHPSKISKAARFATNWKMLAMISVVGFGWMSL